MAPRSAMRSLMTGAALASLTTAAMADGWNGLIVFGGRDFDSGQYVSHEAVFADGDDDIGDGRARATNRVESDGNGNGGGRDLVTSQRVARALGLGPVNPSQPQTYAGVPTPPDGYNYASQFYDSGTIRDSIIGTVDTGSSGFRDTDGTPVVVDGRSRAGLLNDDERKGDAWGALVVVGSAMRDLRYTANIVNRLDGEVDLNRSFIYLDPASHDFIATRAADNIAEGVRALAGADAGLIVVVNARDVGAIPEVGGDGALLSAADSQLASRESEAEQSETRAVIALTVAQDAERVAVMAEEARVTAEAAYAAGAANHPADSDEVKALALARDDATDTALSTLEEATTLLGIAAEERREADRLALSGREIALRPELDAAIADPNLIAENRTAVTDAYNARLLQQVRGIDGNILLIDQHALFEAVIADPARFGLRGGINQADACIGGNVLHPCNDVSATEGELLFADGVALSGAGHQLAADQITALVSAPAALSGIPTAGISAGRGIADVSRDQLSREQTWKAGIYPFVAGAGAGAKLSESDGFPRHDSRHYSGTAGVKYVAAKGIAVGAAASYQSITSPDDTSSVEYDGSGWFGTVFAGVNTGPVFGSVTATYGHVDYGDATRISRIGAARIRNTGDASGTVGGVTAEAGLRLVEYDILRAGPIANFSHWRSTIDGYAERGWQATAVRTDDLETTSTRAGLGMFMEAGQLIDGQGSLFRAKVLYGHEFGDDTKTASVTPLGGNSAGSFSTEVRGIDDAPLEFGAEVVLGFGGVLTTFGYDGLIGDYTDHRFRIGASMPL